MNKKNKIIMRVIGSLLIIFGMIGVIPSLINKNYIYVIPLTLLAVVTGVMLIAWTLSENEQNKN